MENNDELTMEGLSIRDETGPDNIHMITIKLTSTNYLLWRDQILPLLLDQDMLDYINGSKKAPPMSITSVDGTATTNQNQEYFDWWKADQRVMLLIISSLSEEANTIVLDCKTSADVWIALENAFSNMSESLAHNMQYSMAVHEPTKNNQKWLNNLVSTSSSNTSERDTIEDSLVYEPRHELKSDSVIEARDDNQEHAIWKSSGEKRRNGLFVETQVSQRRLAAEIQDVWDLDIKCTIETQMLSLETLYGAYLLFKIGKPVFGLEMVGGVARFINRDSESDSAKKAFLLHLHQGFQVDRLIIRETGRFPVKRDDGWMEIELGDFYNDKGAGGKVEARLMETKRRNKKGGLIVEGVEFRPKTSSISSTSPILLRDVKPHFFPDKTSKKKCVVVGARELVIAWEEAQKKWLWIHHTDSRFTQVAQLKRVHWLEIKCKIEIKMLSAKTKYGAYLVFKLATVIYGLDSVKSFVRYIGRESSTDAEKRATPVQLSIHTTHQQPPETGCVAVLRDMDGWRWNWVTLMYNRETMMKWRQDCWTYGPRMCISRDLLWNLSSFDLNNSRKTRT